VRAALGQFNPVWLAALAGALSISFVGYYYAYRGVFTIEDGPNLTGRQMRAVVTAGLATFGFMMNGAALFVGFATGTVFTRRTGPLAGAGVLSLVLPVTIWYCGAPLPVAVIGVFTYRLLAFWLPMPVSVAALPTLRTMVKDRLWLV
jgi:hypothetical protein